MYKYKHSHLILIDRIETLRKEIETVSEKDFPDGAPLEVIKVLKVMIDCIESQSKKFFKESLNKPEIQRYYLSYVRNTLTYLEKIHTLIGAVANGGKSSVPWALTRVVKEILEHFNEPKNVEVIYAPIWKLNFSIHPHWLLDLYLNLEEILDENEEGRTLKENLTQVIAINFSYLDRKSPLLYGILGHEIGHIFSTDFFEMQKEIDSNWGKENIFPVIKELNPVESANFYSEVLRARRRAIEELGADLFAAHTVGPAFIFSLFDVLTRFSEDLPPSSSNNYYPSNRLRLSLMLDVLSKKWKFEDDIDSEDSSKKDFALALQLLSKIAQEGTIVDVTPKSKHPVQLAYKYVLEFDVEEMMDELDKKVRSFDYDLFFSRAEELCKRLENYIPPNQSNVDLNSGVDSITILNVTWLTEVKSLWNTDLKDIGSESHLQKLYIHDRLALKAIELAEIQKAYVGANSDQ